MTDARQLADDLLRLTCHDDPLWASLVGIPGFSHLLADRSSAGAAALRADLTAVASRAAAIEVSDPDDAVTVACVASHARTMLAQLDARIVEFAISDLFVSPAAELLLSLPMLTLPDDDAARAYVARLHAIPGYLETVADRHRDGVAAGRVPVAHLVRNAVAHLDRYLAAEDDVLARQELTGEPAAERSRALAEVVRPAFARYRDVLANEIVEHGRGPDRPGVCWLPSGDAIYASLALAHTTTDRTPDELHQTGLELIERLSEEYMAIGSRVFGTTDLQAIFHAMTTDPAMRWRDGDELLASARDAVARAEAATPQWFGRLPSQQCKIEPVPSADAPGSPAAYYLWPSMDGQRPGIYFANTDRAQERDRFVSEVLAFHEAVPGHHFQITIAQELTHLPMFRRVMSPNAYVEGWGLYTERLAAEMGLYTSDVARLGMLAMDSMRAGRLVVDTGVHAKGWTREQAVRYLEENTPMSRLEVGNEIDRYILWPGQALSYMVGRLEIQRIRAGAERALGERFDIRAFHDVVLGNGALPIGVLDDVVTAWVASRP